MKKIIFLIGILVLSFSFASANTLKIGLSSDIRSLDPYFHNETTTNSVLSNIFEGLFYFDKDLNQYPLLAKSYKVVNNTTWIIYLRKGVKFHNGNNSRSG
jgi:peptide/nickel transport system substrate-binding protein